MHGANFASCSFLTWHLQTHCMILAVGFKLPLPLRSSIVKDDLDIVHGVDPQLLAWLAIGERRNEGENP